jgi:hypothetical protein
MHFWNPTLEDGGQPTRALTPSFVLSNDEDDMGKKSAQRRLRVLAATFLVICGCLGGMAGAVLVRDEDTPEVRAGSDKSMSMNVDGFLSNIAMGRRGGDGSEMTLLDDDEALIIDTESLAAPDSPLCQSLVWTTDVMKDHDWTTCPHGEWEEWDTQGDNDASTAHYTEYVGCVHSPQECIELVRLECGVSPYATLDLDGSGDCYCQAGPSALDDDGKFMKSCRVHIDSPSSWMDPRDPADGGSYTWGRK